MNNFFENRTSHRQQETAYMIYMIVGSYFHKCSCRSKALEENLFLHYKEMPVKRQQEKEWQIIRVSEGVLGECLASMAQMNAEVFISKTDEMYVLRFYTGFEDIVVTVDDKGRYDISLVEDEMVA